MLALDSYLNRLYTETNCCKPVAAAKADEEELKLFEAFIKKRHADPDATFKDFVRTPEWRDLYRNVAKKLIHATEEGFGKTLVSIDYGTPDFLMLAQLQENIYFFSAFKNFHFLLKINSFLTDSDGNLREFSKFKKDVLQVNDQYNVRWMETEYNAAVASSQMAANWQGFQENKDDYYLEYQTAGDERVRNSHRKLDGITLPVDDEFWDTYYPPAEWGCRCDVKQVPRSKKEKTDISKLDLPPVKPGFKSNSGKTGEVFSEDHPYFQNVLKEDKKLVEKEAAKETKRNKPKKKNGK